MRLHDWDWEGLDQDFRRATDLNPSLAIVHYWYSEYLMCQGRQDEAVAATEIAYRMDPLSPVIRSSRAMILYLARRYEEAATLLVRACEANPDHFLPYLRLGLVRTRAPPPLRSRRARFRTRASELRLHPPARVRWRRRRGSCGGT